MKLYNSAVIFAGGKSSRMGRDKALLPFGGYSSMSEFQYQKLSKIFNKVYISAKSNKFDFEVEVIRDIYTQSSPMVALISIFEQLNIDEIFVLSVDSVFIDRDIIDTLYRHNNSSSDIIIAKSKFGIEPLCGIYKRGILDSANKLLKKDIHRLKSLLDLVNTQIVKFNNSNKFVNLNYRKDYDLYN